MLNLERSRVCSAPFTSFTLHCARDTHALPRRLLLRHVPGEGVAQPNRANEYRPLLYVANMSTSSTSLPLGNLPFWPLPAHSGQ